MASKIVKKTDFWVSVSVVDPDGAEVSIRMKFKHLPSSEFENLSVGKNGEGIASLVIDWDSEDIGEPYSPEAMAKVLDETPWLPMSMFRSYASSRQGFIIKN